MIMRLLKKHVSSYELINYIRTDVRKIEAYLKIVTEIILEKYGLRRKWIILLVANI